MDIILGTAGHIDHGKTTLVRALTGIDCDRLEEEKRRGITIELGFACLNLPDGRKLGIVDVPGHERFVKNMVAGASGVDCVLLVIAADEGVMPQTREHLEICSLLGVRSGLVALTKTDLVDEEWLNVVKEEIQAALADSFLAHAPIVPVSSSSGQGLEALRTEIFNLLSALPPRPKSDILRLPVDRVFSMKGFGTVVTGTLVSGACSVGEKLCVMPAGKSTRARGLQVHNTAVETAHEGQRCAMNLQGLDVEDIQRGNVVTRPETLFPMKSWLVRVACLKSSPLPIRQRMELHFHHGSGECLARIILRDRDSLEPGQSGIAEIKFSQPLTGVYGDHFVLRAHSPLRAIGGGSIICPCPPSLRKRDPDYARKIAILGELGEADAENQYNLAIKDPERLLALCLALYPAPGTDVKHLRVLSALPQPVLEAALDALAEKGVAFCWDKANACWIDEKALAACLEKCRGRAEELHAKNPLKSYFAPNALLSGWGEKLPEKFTEEVLELAVKNGILSQEGAGLKLARHTVRLNRADEKIMLTLLERIRTGAYAPPFIRELAGEQLWELKKLAPILNYLCDSGQLIKIQEGVYYDAEKFAEMLKKIQDWFSQHEELDVGGLKTLLDISRKYAIPLLEHLDSIRLTYRVGNQRRLRKS